MKRFASAVIFLVLSQVSAFAQTTTIADFHIGMQDKATYHYAQVFQVRGRWIVPDIGYIDFADSAHYRELFVGAGYKILVTKHVTVIEELYFVQATGSSSGNARYIQPWTGIKYALTSKFGGETVFFPYVPLDNAGHRQWVVEHAKLEYSFAPTFKAGVGYGAYKSGNDPWQQKPFITATLAPASGKFGSLELWYQKLPGGKAQAQIRYELVRVGKKKSG